MLSVTRATWMPSRSAEVASWSILQLTMGDDKPLKSAYQLAMERLQKSDEASGIEATPLTDAQRSAIAETRNFYEAKLAEQDVLHHSRLRQTADPAERDTFAQQYRRDRERLTTERDAKIARIRRGGASGKN